MSARTRQRRSALGWICSPAARRESPSSPASALPWNRDHRAKWTECLISGYRTGCFASALLFGLPALVFAFLFHWLAQGQFADIIALSADPLEDVTSLERVDFAMKGAVVVRNEFAKH